jgi:thiamine pyrophosphate-dependent acetolactate synthase large subunit-like protein
VICAFLVGSRSSSCNVSANIWSANHPAWLGLRYGVEPTIKTADVIIVLDCDVPWINTQCHPKDGTKVYHIDVDPLKQQMPVYYIKALRRYRADSYTSLAQINAHLDSNHKEKLSSNLFSDRWTALQELHKKKLDTIAAEAKVDEQGHFGTPYVAQQLKKLCPNDTIWAIEAVTQTAFVADQLQATLPGSWLNCGGGGLGWSGGGALGIKLAADYEGKKRFVCQIVGDGTYLFSVPSSVYWISKRYSIPILTIVLNNKGWNAPRKSMLLVHPDGEGSKVSNEELNISFVPTPDYSGIAKAAAGGEIWAAHASTAEELSKLLPEAIKSVLSGTTAVLDAHLEGPDGKYGGGKAVLVG